MSIKDMTRRQSARIERVMPITVRALDTVDQPFEESTETLSISCHGCQYASKHAVRENVVVRLEIPSSGDTMPTRSARARVIWLGRPRTAREMFRIAVRLEAPGNVWGIHHPPADWFTGPYPIPEGASLNGVPIEAQPYLKKKEIPSVDAHMSRADARAPEEILRYEVALSFAGEDRQYVEETARILKLRGISTFYDNHSKTTLWGKDLFVHFDDIYRTRSKYMVMFISKHYATKLWTNHERKSAQARAFTEKREYILPARFDDTEIPGLLPTVGYLDLRRITPSELADRIIEKVRSE